MLKKYEKTDAQKLSLKIKIHNILMSSGKRKDHTL